MRLHRLRRSLAALGLALAAAMGASAARPDAVLVAADRMVDVALGKLVDAPAVLVLDGRIEKVG